MENTNQKTVKPNAKKMAPTKRRTSVDIINKISQRESRKIVTSFIKWYDKMKDKCPCAIGIEITLAKVCCMLYNRYADDKAIIKFVRKEANN